MKKEIPTEAPELQSWAVELRKDCTRLFRQSLYSQSPEMRNRVIVLLS